MHVRTLSSQAQAGKEEEILKILHESIVPAIKEQNGYKNATILLDLKTGKLLSLSFWESEDQMHASESNGYLREQLAKLAHLLALPPVQQDYEVMMQV